MKTPDCSQNAHRRALAKLMKLVAAWLGSLTLVVPGATLRFTEGECVIRGLSK